MKNIFNKTNAPYLVASALATVTLLASGVFAIAPYVGFLAPVAALSVGLPFIIGGAIISAVAIAFSAVAISKNNTISEKSTEISSLEKQLAKKEKAIEAKNKMIANPNKDDELKRQHRKEKQEEVLDCADLRNLFKEEKKQEEVLDPVALSNLFDENSEKGTEISSPESQSAKEENGQGWTAWGKAKVAATVTTGIGLCGAVLYCAAPYIPTVLNGVVAPSVGSECGYTNGIALFIEVRM